MIKLIVTIGLIVLNCYNVQSSDLCQLTGTTGKSSPDILSLVKDQTGYSGIVEIVDSSKQFTNQVKDYYDSSRLVGLIEWLTSGEGSSLRSIHYYGSSLESFIINSGSAHCVTKGLTKEDKLSIVSEWMSPEMKTTNPNLWTNFLNLETGHSEYLGPIGLMIMASALSAKSGYFVGQTMLDDFSVNQWSLCVSPSDSDIVVDTYFLTSSSLPYRLVISSQSLKVKILFNILTYDPIVLKDQLVTYPIGHGCERTFKYDNPVWGSTDSYLIDMEAAISFNSPERLRLSTMKLIKHQNTYSYLISEGESNTTRIIKTPSLLQYFKVNPRTGHCSIEHEESFFKLTSKDVTTQWPLLEDDSPKYNLLSSSLYNLDGTNYLGPVRTDYGVMNVFEKIVDSFFTNSANERVNCLVQFYFPEAVTHDRHEPPHHIMIRPFSASVEDEVLMASVPSRIEITYINYQTGDDVGYDLIDPIDYADAFDVSGCYDEPNQYTWFQLVFPDTTLDIARYQEKDAIIYHAFSALIEPLIPLLRLPDIRITIFGPNIYITCKLLQAETFNFISSPSSVLTNPTQLVIREYMEDCSELCLDSEYCLAFSHCGNMECYLLTTPNAQTITSEHREDCTLYYSLSDTDLKIKSQVEMNLLKSSKNILHQLKRKLEQGQLVLPNLKLSAGDLFIVNNPDEIGGVDEEIPFGQHMDRSSTGDDFRVLLPNLRVISDSRIVGLNYQSCLALCNNDDDCYTLSYCPAPTSECVLMNKTNDQVLDNYKDFTSYVDGCDILSKSFESFYRKLPGRSLILDAVATFPNVRPDECARICTLTNDFDCQSFDFCPQVENEKEKKTESACFLHSFHVATDKAHELEGNIWDFSQAECDHYSKRLSKDYQHFIGNKLRANTRILKTKVDISLENCAFQCNNLNDHCTTFEYCESVDSTFTSTCRLSSYIVYGTNDEALESTSSSSSLCSVYVNKKSRARSFYGQYGDYVEGGLGMAIALGAFFFISAFAIGTIASHLYIKRYS